MNRAEALRILGLDEDATADDIKVAYRETAQILHPDRFASNKKLQDRATEQFKTLQEAYDYLTKGKGASGRSPRNGRSRAGAASSADARSASAGGRRAQDDIEARMAGIAAARTQLVKQRDLVLDERRNGIAMAVVGALVALFARRIVWLAGIASAAAVWGIVQVVSAQRTLDTLGKHINELKKEERELAELLDEE